MRAIDVKGRLDRREKIAAAHPKVMRAEAQTRLGNDDAGNPAWLVVLKDSSRRCHECRHLFEPDANADVIGVGLGADLAEAFESIEGQVIACLKEALDTESAAHRRILGALDAAAREREGDQR